MSDDGQPYFIVSRNGVEHLRRLTVDSEVGKVLVSFMMIRVHVYTTLASCLLVVLCMYFPVNDDHRVLAIALWAMGEVSAAYAFAVRRMYVRAVKAAEDRANRHVDDQIYQARLRTEIDLLTRPDNTGG